jgi:cation transport protein ChaC
MSSAPHDLWVFAYGSLMWRPGFRYAEARHARLIGWRRCFCIFSIYHRGTMARPGLVLGLDRGGACEGIAYRVAASDVAETVGYLRAREQVNGVYREAHVCVELIGEARREVMALAYIVERAHPSYAGRLSLLEEARLIRGASGRSGNNVDYLISTLRHLDELGIRERELQRVLTLIGPHTARCGTAGHASPYVAGLLGVARRQPAPRRNIATGDPRRFLYRQRLE